MTMPDDDDDMLDNPVWSALNGDQARLGEGGSLARRFQPEVSPFAAVIAVEERPLCALRDLIAIGASAMTVTRDAIPEAKGLRVTYLFDVLQMVDLRAAAGEIEAAAFRLTSDDAADMLALAERTKPGPFGPRTCEMGEYIGLRHEGRLVAMAGERMRFGRYVEISAVCVDEALRGRGIASRLMNDLRLKIRQRGSIPFLHVRSEATATIRMYEKLGFTPRAEFNLHELTAPK
jgi:ribosomal protein S18 acetylase RimI-like enzyme